MDEISSRNGQKRRRGAKVKRREKASSIVRRLRSFGYQPPGSGTPICCCVYPSVDRLSSFIASGYLLFDSPVLKSIYIGITSHYKHLLAINKSDRRWRPNLSCLLYSQPITSLIIPFLLPLRHPLTCLSISLSVTTRLTFNLLVSSGPM